MVRGREGREKEEAAAEIPLPQESAMGSTPYAEATGGGYHTAPAAVYPPTAYAYNPVQQFQPNRKGMWKV